MRYDVGGRRLRIAFIATSNSYDETFPGLSVSVARCTSSSSDIVLPYSVGRTPSSEPSENTQHHQIDVCIFRHFSMQSSSGNSPMIPTGAFHHRKCPISLLMDPTLLKPSHNNSIGNAGGDATSLRTSCRIEIMKHTRSLSQHPVAAVCHTALSLTDVHKLSTEPPKSISGNIHFICSLRFSQLGGI